MHKLPSLLEYKSLTSLDMPEVETVLIEEEEGMTDPNCPFGAKEVGQGPLLPVMPAVANAIFDAVGVRIDELPITPDKVLRALEEEGRQDADGAEAVSRRRPLPEPILSCRPGKAATARRETKAATHDAAAVV